ncbi:Protein tincar [Trichinella nelsoni]|uniref:Protein tincar n=2 Tax=Trichinella nelsoni TaxID=6336 RepID=A0A0V0RGA8_9BILA|nr:Protein tincar [Trichinella nelsoni]
MDDVHHATLAGSNKYSLTMGRINIPFCHHLYYFYQSITSWKNDVILQSGQFYLLSLSSVTIYNEFIRVDILTSNKMGCLYRAELNSIASIWYCFFFVFLQGYLLYVGIERYSTLAESKLNENSSSFLPLYIGLHGLAVTLLPFFIVSAIFKVGNLANDCVRIGEKRPPIIHTAGNWCCRKLKACWLHGLPVTQTLHLIIASTFLLCGALVEAEFQGDESQLRIDEIWFTELKFVYRNQRFRIPSYAPYENDSRIEQKLHQTVIPVRTFGISLPFLNYACALVAFAIVYPSVFWRASRSFSLVFSMHLMIHAISALFCFVAYSILRQVYIAGLYDPAHQTPFLLQEPFLVIIYLATTAVMLFASMVVYGYGYNKYCLCVLSARGHCRLLHKVYSVYCEGYSAHIAAIVMLVMMVLCKAPILYDLMVLYQHQPQPMLLSCIISDVCYLFLWILLWLGLTLKRDWTFTVRHTLTELGNLLDMRTLEGQACNESTLILLSDELAFATNNECKKLALLQAAEKCNNASKGTGEVYWLKSHHGAEDSTKSQKLAPLNNPELNWSSRLALCEDNVSTFGTLPRAADRQKQNSHTTLYHHSHGWESPKVGESTVHSLDRAPYATISRSQRANRPSAFEPRRTPSNNAFQSYGSRQSSYANLSNSTTLNKQQQQWSLTKPPPSSRSRNIPTTSVQSVDAETRSTGNDPTFKPPINSNSVEKRTTQLSWNVNPLYDANKATTKTSTINSLHDATTTTSAHFTTSIKRNVIYALLVSCYDICKLADRSFNSSISLNDSVPLSNSRSSKRTATSNVSSAVRFEAELIASEERFYVLWMKLLFYIIILLSAVTCGTEIMRKILQCNGWNHWESERKEIEILLTDIMARNKELEKKLNMILHLTSSFYNHEKKIREYFDEHRMKEERLIENDKQLTLLKEVDEYYNEKERNEINFEGDQIITHNDKVLSSLLNNFLSNRFKWINFADEYNGAKILDIPETEPYPCGSFLSYWTGYRYLTFYQSARKHDTKSDECWTFKGNKGNLIIGLKSNVLITGFSYEHSASSNETVNYSKLTAPKEINFYGLVNLKDKKPWLFGSYIYNANSSEIQYFSVEAERIQMTSIIHVEIIGNYGNMPYTCIHRFRVYGILPFVDSKEDIIPLRSITAEFPKNSITNITEIMDQFTEQDAEDERSYKARQDVLEMISCYQEILHERKL